MNYRYNYSDKLCIHCTLFIHSIFIQNAHNNYLHHTGIPIAVKLVYTEFYHQLVEAVSDPHTCQSLTAQLRSTTWISQEKIAELSHGGITGSDLLNVLGVAKEPHLLTVLIEKMAGVKQLQRLAELMSARLCEVKQGACLLQ